MKIIFALSTFLFLLGCKKNNDAVLKGPKDKTLYTNTNYSYYVSNIKVDQALWQFNGKKMKDGDPDVLLSVEEEGGYGLIVRNRYSRKIHINTILYFLDISKSFGEKLEITSASSSPDLYTHATFTGTNSVGTYTLYDETEGSFLRFKAKIEKPGEVRTQVEVTRRFLNSSEHYIEYTEPDLYDLEMRRNFDLDSNQVYLFLSKNGSPYFAGHLTVYP